MAQFEEFSVLSVLEKGGFVVYHVDDGWHIYPGGLTIDESDATSLAETGHLSREQIDSETTKFYITPEGIGYLEHLRNISTNRSYELA